jgi:hypothetical protein
VRAPVVGDRADHSVVEVRSLDEMLGGVDSRLLHKRIVVERQYSRLASANSPYGAQGYLSVVVELGCAFAVAVRRNIKRCRLLRTHRVTPR